MSNDREHQGRSSRLEQLARLQDGSRKLQATLRELVGTAEDRGEGMLRVMVDAQCRLVSLEISDEVHQRLSAVQLRDRILELHDSASADVELQVMNETKAVFGMGFTPGQVSRGEVDPTEIAAESRKRTLGGLNAG